MPAATTARDPDTADGRAAIVRPAERGWVVDQAAVVSLKPRAQTGWLHSAALQLAEDLSRLNR